MRSATLLLVLAVLPGPLMGQQAAATPSPTRNQDSASRPQPSAVEAVDTTRLVLGAATLDSLRELVATFRRDPQAKGLPATDDIAMGGRTIGAGTQVEGPVATAGGPLHVFGTVNGDAFAIGSDVIVHQNGRITGNAIAALGTVALDGGTVDGEMRQLSGALGDIPTTVAAEESPLNATRHAIALSASWLVILVLIGIGVLVFAGSYLD